MTDQMLETLYTEDFVLSPKHVDPDDKENIVRNEFHVFRDYLGLINLVQPEGFGSKIESGTKFIPHAVENVFDFVDFGKFPSRKRLDSLDSDLSGNSLGSHSDGEMNMVFNDSIISSQEVYKPSIIGEPLAPRAEIIANRIAGKISKSSKSSILSSERQRAGQRQVCVFCRNNGENRELYSGHTLKDADGNTTCPILRAYTCPLCKASGDKSHTIKYCPKYTPKPKDKILPI